jgi:hypothetical protein
VDKEISELDPQLLPITVKLGIAPSISLHANGTYWGSEVGHVSPQVKKLLGCRPPPYENMEAVALQDRLKDQGITARQAIACAKGGFGEGVFPTYPEEVKGLPPVQPNAYTDGGLKNPTNHQWACAGFGIWIPRSVHASHTPSVHVVSSTTAAIPTVVPPVRSMQAAIGERHGVHNEQGTFHNTGEEPISYTGEEPQDHSHTPTDNREGASYYEDDICMDDGTVQPGPTPSQPTGLREQAASVHEDSHTPSAAMTEVGEQICDSISADAMPSVPEDFSNNNLQADSMQHISRNTCCQNLIGEMGASMWEAFQVKGRARLAPRSRPS